MKFFCGVTNEVEVERVLINTPNGSFIVWLKKYDNGNLMIVLTWSNFGRPKHVPIMRDPKKKGERLKQAIWDGEGVFRGRFGKRLNFAPFPMDDG